MQKQKDGVKKEEEEDVFDSIVPTKNNVVKKPVNNKKASTRGRGGATTASRRGRPSRKDTRASSYDFDDNEGDDEDEDHDDHEEEGEAYIETENMILSWETRIVFVIFTNRKLHACIIYLPFWHVSMFLHNWKNYIFN